MLYFVAGVGLPPLLPEPESMLFNPFRVFPESPSEKLWRVRTKYAMINSNPEQARKTNLNKE